MKHAVAAGLYLASVLCLALACAPVQAAFDVLTPNGEAPECDWDADASDGTSNADPSKLNLPYVVMPKGVPIAAGHYLDVHYPKRTGLDPSPPYKTLIWVAGGEWRTSDRTQIRPAQRLLCQGYAVVSVDHRHSYVAGATYPAQIHDIKAAIRYLRANAAKLNLDTERIVMFGNSSGAHLSALAATTHGIEAVEDLSLGWPTASSRVQLLVDWYAPLAFALMNQQLDLQSYCTSHPNYNKRKSATSELLDCVAAINCDPALLALSNPMTYVDASDAPALIMHGALDCSVPFEQSVMMEHALEAAGVKRESYRVNFGEHGGPAWMSEVVQTKVATYINTELPLTAAESTQPTLPVARCENFTYIGDPAGVEGAAWFYEATDSGMVYKFGGRLYLPTTLPDGPLRTVILSHGESDTPADYWNAVAPLFTARGMLVIAPVYTHGKLADVGNLPPGLWAASNGNLLRLHKTRALLSCFGHPAGGQVATLREVDLTKIALHGHEAGAYVNVQAAGTYPADFAVATHTAGGAVNYKPQKTDVRKPAEKTVAQRIRIPYAQYYASDDQVVSPQITTTLDVILTANLGAANRLKKRYAYPGDAALDHLKIATEPLVFSDPVTGVFAWYVAQGVLPGP